MIVEAVRPVQQNTTEFMFIRQILFAGIYNWMDVCAEKTRTVLFGESGRRTGHESHLPLYDHCQWAEFK